MPSRLIAAASLTRLLVAAVLASPQHADACSLALSSDPGQRLRQNVEWAELIVIGTVIDEVQTTNFGNLHRYDSTVQVGLVLRGDSSNSIEILGLGALGADCSGGPRLRTGERVLLFLGEGWGGPAWRIGPDGGKYLLQNGEAFVEQLFGIDDSREAPRDEIELIAEISELTGTPPIVIDQHVDALTPDDGKVSFVPWLPLVGVLLLFPAGWLWLRVRWRSRPR